MGKDLEESTEIEALLRDQSALLHGKYKANHRDPHFLQLKLEHPAGQSSVSKTIDLFDRKMLLCCYTRLGGSENKRSFVASGVRKFSNPATRRLCRCVSSV